MVPDHTVSDLTGLTNGFVNLPDAGRVAGQDPNLGGCSRSTRHHVRCFRHQLLLPRPYLVLTKPLRLDIQCQRAASVKIGWKYLDD